jgi:hypothetical protein
MKYPANGVSIIPLVEYSIVDKIMVVQPNIFANTTSSKSCRTIYKDNNRQKDRIVVARLSEQT